MGGKISEGYYEGLLRKVQDIMLDVELEPDPELRRVLIKAGKIISRRIKEMIKKEKQGG